MRIFRDAIFSGACSGFGKLSEARPELSSQTLIPVTRLLNWFCPEH